MVQCPGVPAGATFCLLVLVAVSDSESTTIVLSPAGILPNSSKSACAKALNARNFSAHVLEVACAYVRAYVRADVRSRFLIYRMGLRLTVKYQMLAVSALTLMKSDS